MPSLVIHAPQYQPILAGVKSFDEILETGIGGAYALNRIILKQILPDGIMRPGWKVVLLCKDRKRRAEGKLVKIEPALRSGQPWFTKNHIRRYDIYVGDFELMPYRTEALNRNGVAVV